ncbi:MAG: low-specificity L-threonine aldolase [Myxococcota bacterium]
MDSIDFRSDTVTWPTEAMREAMARAAVGDDVWGDDPTTQRLEALAAERVGTAAALLVASGTMGNLLAIMTHCQHGDEMIAGREAHTFVHEVGGAAAVAGVQINTLAVQHDGTLALEDIRAAMRDPHDLHLPRTRLITLENTQSGIGGIPITAAYTREVRALCDAHGLRLHLDGARLWNAAVALGCEARELVAPVDSVSFCLSKGLCAPVGSLLCGSTELVARARRLRKMLGGGMRQTGVLAAAGIIALEQMTERLVEDHAHARQLAEGLAAIDGIGIDLTRVQTNLVFFDLKPEVPFDGAALCVAMWQKYGLKLADSGPRTLRAVTHYWIRREHIEQLIEAVRAELHGR